MGKIRRPKARTIPVKDGKTLNLAARDYPVVAEQSRAGQLRSPVVRYAASDPDTGKMHAVLTPVGNRMRTLVDRGELQLNEGYHVSLFIEVEAQQEEDKARPPRRSLGLRLRPADESQQEQKRSRGMRR